VLKYIGKPSKQIERDLGHCKAEHFLQRTSMSLFGLPTEMTYHELKENVILIKWIVSLNMKILHLIHTRIIQKKTEKPYK